MVKSLFLKLLKVIAVTTPLMSSINASTGVYCGIGLGGTHLAAKRNLSVNDRNFNSVLHDSSVRGELFVGYTKPINNIWLTVEIHGSLSNLETTELLDLFGINIKQPLKVKSSHGAGLAFHIGHCINPISKAYIKLGVEVKKFYSEFKGHNNINNTPINHNENFYSVGFVPGFGIETDIDPKTTFRMEYHIAFHPSKHCSHPLADKRSVSLLKVTPKTHNITFGIHYKI